MSRGDFIAAFAALSSIINMVVLIWVAAAKNGAYKVKVDTIWDWFTRNVLARRKGDPNE